MATTNSSNTYRKVRGLLDKTVAAGCTPGESAASLSRASAIISAHRLDRSLLVWPAAPIGYEWVGEPGNHDKAGEVVEVPQKEASKAPEASESPKKAPRARKKPGTSAKAGSKVDRLMTMLAEGATVPQLMEALGFVHEHTLRSAISTGKKKAGVSVLKDRKTGIYRIV